MTIAKVTEELSVAPQLGKSDIAEAARLGFRAIINNRPDGEEKGQPGASELAEAAEHAGLEYRHIPVVPGQIGEPDIDAFAQTFAELPKPVLAFCRTGNRSISLWALSRAGEKTPGELLETAQKAGYDLSGLEDRLRKRAAA